MKNSVIKLVTVVSAAMTLLALGGCSSSGDTQTLQRAQASSNADTSSKSQSLSQDLPPENIQKWTMPLDPYVYSYASEANYAENLLIQPCMKKEGYDYPVPWINPDAQRSASFNAVGVRLFNVDLARSWGYHTAPETDPGVIETQKLNQEPLSPAEDSALTTCITQVRKTELPSLPFDAQNAAGYTSDAVDQANQTEAVKSAAARWRECMAPAGISDLPRSPNNMPTQSMMTRFGFGIQDGSDDDPSTITADEITVATQDAQCRDSSGWTQSLYDAQWNAEIQVMNKNADDLNRIAEELAKNHAAVAKVIAEHAVKQ